MNFLYPNTLWFLLLLSIPILIHLFHFRKHKKIYFSSLRFMKSFQKEKKAVKKLQNLIILICRLIALGFLVLAFSQPFYNANDQSNPSFESIVSIYIDNSFSMTAIFLPCCSVKICFNKVVFPLPKKPVRIVTGINAIDDPIKI